MVEFKKNTWFYPLAVAIIGTYDEDNTPNAMNAAWVSIYDYNTVLLNLSEHKTTKNLEKNKALTIAFATKSTIEASDYVGLVSGDKVKDKVYKAGLTPVKAPNVNAPLFKEYPLTLECTVRSIDEDYHVICDIVAIQVDESILTNNKIDPKKLEAVSFDPVNNKYLLLSGEVVADAFSIGLNIKNKA